MHGDVLIIGAGSAGAVVAERLSLDPACRVIVVEAGPGLAEPGVSEMTADVSVLPIGTGSPLVRRYQTLLTARPARRAQIVRGAVVGGSGAVNGGYFCRGLPRDFDRWGLPGWSWPEVLSHFRAIENDADFADAAHGHTGPIPVRRVREFAPSTREFIERARSAGYPWIADLNAGAAAFGIGAVPLNTADGARIGPGVAFLEPATRRKNVTLLTRTHVRRVRFSSGRAVGVDAHGPGGPVELSADRVVACAGAIGSAHLLMLSGIGDEAVSRRAGVPVVQPAPVGRQCIDHPEWVIPVDWETEAGRPILEAVLTTDFDIEIRPYTGGFIAMVGHGTTGYPDWPHLGVALMQPRSRARVTLVSHDPAVPPRIEHRYDSEPADVEALRHGSILARELCSSARQIGVPMWSTSQHLCGSAPMGAESDERAVLDERCRVRGVTGLWVIDGATLPGITSRGPHASIVMLAHRAAEFVVND